jgi:hypothetical protein
VSCGKKSVSLLGLLVASERCVKQKKRAFAPSKAAEKRQTDQSKYQQSRVQQIAETRRQNQHINQYDQVRSRCFVGRTEGIHNQHPPIDKESNRKLW